ncbi:HD domain-containing phosphohydrolase [Aestuariirhabdus sp. LZHN29]|uniref:HD domain-containing phosphohydrolase n=1 Tax=Aestuariirhabdus sp. LZHN29 TaxID=3417462 RepID=UPI003CEF1C6A
MSEFMFSDDVQGDTPPPAPSKCWRVLVVDDDPAIHQVTRMVLGNLKVENRRIELLSAHSGHEARALLKDEPNIAMAFIDVVMETEHAGLDLVRWIREELKNQSIRLILRTGQAGQAPEERVVREYDINGYKEKTDFVANKMISTLYAGIRGYRDITTIQKSLTGLRRLIEASNDMLKIRQLKAFGSAALDNLLTLMELDASALYIAHTAADVYSENRDLVIACTGKYVSCGNDLNSCDLSPEVRASIRHTFSTRQHTVADHYFTGYYETPHQTASVLYVEHDNYTDHLHVELLDMYTASVSLILENLTSHHEIEQDLLYIIGGAIESRSPTAGTHTERVAMMSEFIALKLGLSEAFASVIRTAAALHDIGMVTVSESILAVPGPLSEEQRQIVQQHAAAGGELLQRGNGVIAKAGARIARHHHENWDGSGYPDGLQGEEIPIEARIVALTDRIECLSSARPYRPAWSDPDIRQHLKKQRGKEFDPQLAELAEQYFEQLIAIRERNPKEMDR